MLYIDQDYIYRAIDNLIENAQKYGQYGSPIRIELSYDESFLSISVHDKGPGIPEEHLPFLFHRSYRIDKSRNTSIPGHGLGLAIVKEIVTAHHGQVSVKSEWNKGATFTIRLPFREKRRALSS